MRLAYALILVAAPVFAEDCASLPKDDAFQCVMRAVDKWAQSNTEYEMAKARREAAQSQLETMQQNRPPSAVFTNCLWRPGGYTCTTQ